MDARTKSRDAASDLYEPRLESARARFAGSPGLTAVLSPTVAPALLERFLIQFCALGVGMTEPVEGWIRRAGDRCEAIGLRDLGRTLRTHAGHEAGHHELMIRDTRTLVARWNGRRTPPLDAAALLAEPLTPGVRRYRQLHEDVIAGDAPFGQLAIEYEIEALSVRFGPPLIGNCRRVLGDDILKGLSFIEEHVALDGGHTALNRKELDKLLSAHPEYLDSLVRTGQAALEAYGMFLQDCLTAARTAVGQA
jgi:hypothetical protein